MKKPSQGGKTTLVTTIAALAAIVLGPQSIAMTSPGAKHAKDQSVISFQADLRDGKIQTMGDLVNRMRGIPRIRGFVILENGTDLLVTEEGYAKRKTLFDYPATVLVRASNPSLFAPLQEHFGEDVKNIRDGGHYFCLS